MSGRVKEKKSAVRPPRRLTPAQLVRRVEALQAELAPALPDVDPGDLVLILQSVLRPIGSGRRYFLKKTPSGGYVF